jgi:hypothetical protein
MRLIVAALLLIIAAPALAQADVARELVPGKPIAAPAGKANAPDIYTFVGQAGSRVSFTLKIKGDAEIALFGPQGEQMLNVAGSGTVTLDAVLSWLDVHSVAVLRRDPSQPYTLAMTATEPTLAEALTATAMGYTITPGGQRPFVQCWTKPGVIAAVRGQDLRGLSMLSADRESVIVITKLADGPQVASILEYRIEGDELIRTTRGIDGDPKETRYEYEPAVFQREPITKDYVGYNCPASFTAK